MQCVRDEITCTEWDDSILFSSLYLEFNLNCQNPMGVKVTSLGNYSTLGGKFHIWASAFCLKVHQVSSGGKILNTGGDTGAMVRGMSQMNVKPKTLLGVAHSLQ